MALVAKMKAMKIEQTGNGRYVGVGDVPEDLSEEQLFAAGIIPVEKTSSYYGIPPWFAGFTHVRLDPNLQSQENFKLAAVSARGEDDPNRDWAAATPAGTLEMWVDNPRAFGYIEAGAEYRVTIERIRGPREPKEDKELPHLVDLDAHGRKA